MTYPDWLIAAGVGLLATLLWLTTLPPRHSQPR
jgi:hypothetical protein